LFDYARPAAHFPHKDATSVNLPRLLLRLLLGHRLPHTAGTLSIPGNRASLRIHRDHWGVPYIEAQNDADAHFGVGFCHGQDRAFQMEMLLRLVRGTLAELVGPAALPVDRLSRRIGFHHAAGQQFAVLDSEVRETLEAYSHGVTAGATLGLPRRPHEFALLRSRPSPWTPLDSLGFIKVISFTLCANWDSELARLRVLRTDGPEALAALDPAYPEWLPITSPPGQAAGSGLARLSEEISAFLAVTGAGGGSNNWAVAASRTATGRPLLANDPHLSAGLPAHWYLAHVRTPEWAAAGATFPGGPNIVAGHNGHAAWGVTAGLIDNTDLFREQIGSDGCSVREGDRFVPCPVREEVIHVKGGETLTERVLVTPRGPIVSPALEAGDEALSLRALWLDPLPVRGLLTVHRTRNFAEFRRELAHWPLASQNVAYADTYGTIGWQMMGQAPRRRKGGGLIPQAGWEPDAGWEPSPVSFDEMPHDTNPACGFLATANTKPWPDGAGPYLGSDFIDGYRLAAINRSLSSRTDWDVTRTFALQMDQQTLAWEDVREAILAVPGAELLRDWDGRTAEDSSAASVFELFLVEMATRVVRTKAPKSAEYALGKGLSPITHYNFMCFRRTGHLARLLREQPAGWFNRSWPDEIADALAVVLRRLQEAHGEAKHWAWGRLRSLIMHHPLGRGRFLSRVFNLGPVPCGGDSDTINQASVLLLEPLEPTDNIASLRAVLDVGAWDNSRFVLPGGQSGNPLSPNYADMFPLWRRGEGVPIAWAEEEIRKVTRATLQLLPVS
jgi:penicillin amidase